MTARNSLTYSRRTGIWTALGISAGISWHIFYCVAGLAFVISKSILFFNFIKLLGAGYLIFVGIKSLRSKSSTVKLGEHDKKSDISRRHAFKIGFLTNVLNPKATVFFLSIFTLVIAPDTPAYLLAIISGVMIATTAGWFSLVAIFLTQHHVRAVYHRFQGTFNKTFGGILIALGIKVAVTEK